MIPHPQDPPAGLNRRVAPQIYRSVQPLLQGRRILTFEVFIPNLCAWLVSDYWTPYDSGKISKF